MRYLDLFSGIGGFAKGFQDAGLEFDKHYASEIDKYARSIYARQFPESVQLGDVTRIGDELGKIDIITGGFPCQSFSIAGARRGFEDTRGTLFFDIARLASIYRPKYMVLENVKGLLNHDGGNTIRVILDKLRGLDYFVQLLLLNTKDLNVPQNRERLFFICSAPRERRPEIFHIRERKTEIAHCDELIGRKDGLFGSSYSVYNPDSLSVTLKSEGGGVGAKTGLYAVNKVHGKYVLRNDDTSTNLDANYYKGIDNHGARTGVAIPCLSPDRPEKRQNGRRFKENGDPMFTLTAQDRHGVLVKSATKSGYEVAHEGDSINFSVPNSQTRRGRVGKKVAQTLDTACNQGVFDEFNIRRLTPIECERLQAFPDDWTKYGEDGSLISDSQRYKCLGNAVTVDVVKEIARSIKESLTKGEKK